MGARPRRAWPAAVLVPVLLCACDPATVDPTDPADFSAVVFVNDTGSPAVLFECGDSRGHGCHDMSGPLAPGERCDQRVYWGAGPDPWQVRDTRGRTLGWLVVDSPRRESGAVYHLGDAQPRADRPTAPRTPPHPVHAAAPRPRRVVGGADVG
ncbi:hypothetical protein [Streptomyces sp. KHY 26]|uniref:hypothetical protein n=1 Tax=Streptomyces sp. KHY 26 TaxID=3097359 RepID=UPI00376EEFFD